jgi:hypothetical protein
MQTASPYFLWGNIPPSSPQTEVPTAVMICCDTGVYASPNCACPQYLDYFIRSIPIPLLRMWAWIDSDSGVASCSSFAVAPGSSHFWLAASRTPAGHCIGSGFQALQKPAASRELNRCAMSSTSSMAFTMDHLSPRAVRSVPCFARPQTRRRVRVVEPQETPNHGCYTLWRTQRHTRTLPAAFSVQRPGPESCSEAG